MASSTHVEGIVQRLAIAIARAGITPQALFEQLDTNKDGRLSTSELDAVVARLQPDLPAAERQAIFKKFDLDASGEVSADEFLTILHAHAPPPQPTATGVDATASSTIRARDVMIRVVAAMARLGIAPQELFGKVDTDRSKRLSMAEFEQFVLQFEPHLPAAECHRLFEAFDADGSGEVDVQEFCSAIGRVSACVSAQGCHGTVLGNDHAPPKPLVAKSAPEAYQPGSSLKVSCRVEQLIDRLAASIARIGVTPEELFQKLDRNGDGHLSGAELEILLVQFQPDIAVAEFQRLFQRFDIDRNGEIDRREFCRLLRLQPGAESSSGSQHRCGVAGVSGGYAPPKAVVDWGVRA